MSYDPEARRDTPLALKLKAQIRERGPMPVSEFMAACLQDPEHGYYRTRQAIGRDGDFITAPEISQIFGELIGLWAVVVWQQMGSPQRFNLIELGPGRGTLMADTLRAARLAPKFIEAANVVLVETSDVLRKAQADLLGPLHTRIEWTAQLQRIGDAGGGRGPAIVIANEFLDCIPAAQLVRNAGGWGQRSVGLDDSGRLAFRAGPAPGPAPRLDSLFPSARDGDIVELADYGLADPLRALPVVAALFIDYGHTAPQVGDTLQALRNHAYEHPLTSPGEADLTQHVDFSALVRDAGSLAVDGPVTQAEFLGALGIAERASRLMAANPARAGTIEQAVARLMSPTGMGGRFKAIGLRTASLPPLPGLAPSRRR